MPEYAIAKHVLYKKHPGHILSGFSVESVRGGLRISRFTFPLYDISESLNLSYSAPLPWPNDFIDNESYESPRARADEFIARAFPFVQEIEALGRLENFCAYLQKSIISFAKERRDSRIDPYLRYGYAATLVLLEKFDEACNQFEIVKNDFLLFMKSRFHTTIMGLNKEYRSVSSIPMMLTDDRRSFLSDVNVMIDLIHSAPAMATQRLMDRERRNKIKYSIS